MRTIINNTYIYIILYDVKDTPRFLFFSSPINLLRKILRIELTFILMLLSFITKDPLTPSPPYIIFHLYSKLASKFSRWLRNNDTWTLQRSSGFQVACLTSDTSSIHTLIVSRYTHTHSMRFPAVLAGTGNGWRSGRLARPGSGMRRLRERER